MTPTRLVYMYVVRTLKAKIHSKVYGKQSVSVFKMGVKTVASGLGENIFN